jgi:hypothetical protein
MNGSNTYQPTSSREWNWVVMRGMAVATMDVSSIIKKMTRTNDSSTLSNAKPVRYASSSSFLGGGDAESTWGSFSMLVVDMLVDVRMISYVAIALEVFELMSID